MTDVSVERTLGMLVAQVKNMQDALERSEQKSDEHRSGVHRRLDEVVNRVGSLEGGMRMVTEDISDIKPVTEDVKKWKIMGMTAIAIIGVGGAAMGVTFAEAIRRVLDLVLGRA